MNISRNWLKRYINFDFSTAELENILTMLGIEVESYQDLKKKYDGFFIGEVVSKEKHPKSDILSLCAVNIGDEELQIVCGAPNVAQNQKVVVGKIGALVPKNQMKLAKRKIRDIYSEGMICSQAELELGEDESGIWVLPNDAKIGLSAAEYFEIDDVILDISLTPNKADCASHIGIAREIAAFLRKKINPIDTKANFFEDAKYNSAKSLNDFINIDVKNPELCPRYSARVIQNVKNGESPNWLKKELQNIGLRPINIVVDVTNYVLMDLGQPLHAFDFDKLSINKSNNKVNIVVQNGFKNQKFVTLDEKERILDEKMLMICNDENPIAIAGIMGGKNSEIDENTTNVILESAFFSPDSIRKTAKKFNLSTDASYRYERGADIDMAIPAIDKAAKLIAELTGGKILNGIAEVYYKKAAKKKINFRFNQARKIIGKNISNEEMKDIFNSLGFEILNENLKQVVNNQNVNEIVKEITLKIPNRRVDIFGEIDLIEEIARVVNYDNIEPIFASAIDFQRKELPASLLPNPFRAIMRNYLSNNGFNEILTYSITDTFSASLSNEKAITIENPLGEEMSKMRPSMITSMLKIISFNVRQGTQNLKLFETGKNFLPQNNIFNSFIDGIDEREQLIMAICGNETPRQWGISERKFDFFDIKGNIQELFAHLKISKYKIKSINEENLNNENAFFDENSAGIWIDKKQVGITGSIRKNILQKYEINLPIFLATIDLTNLSEINFEETKFQEISQFPMMKRDLAFILDEKYFAEEIKKNIISKANNLLKSVDIFDVYKGKNIENNKKSVGFELTFSSSERTLTDKEIEIEISKIIDSVEKNFNAILRKS